MSDCICIPCDECGGSGSVWFSFSHKYLGRHRCDDLDELETCEECHGSGIEEMCGHCRELEEEAEWQEQEAAVNEFLQYVKDNHIKVESLMDKSAEQSVERTVPSKENMRTVQNYFKEAK